MTQPTGPGPISLAGVIPPAFSAQIISEAVTQSAALALGSRVPMSTSVSTMPVPKTFPRAAWVAAAGGRKPYTDLSLDVATMTAEEVAAVVSIPDVYLEDSAINLWGYAQPLLSEAIAIAVDDAMIWGVDAPGTFPAGGVAANAVNVAAAGDAVATVNNAMSAVEAQGVRVTGNAADNTVLGALRGVRDGSGALLLGPAQAASADVNAIFGVPTRYSMFPSGATGDFITGAWRYLVIGVRQDIRFRFSQEGVIADEAGAIKVSAFQDNQTLLKVWARFACAIVKPLTARGKDRNGGPADPWAITDVAEGAANGASSSGTESASATPTKSTSSTSKSSASA